MAYGSLGREQSSLDELEKRRGGFFNPLSFVGDVFRGVGSAVSGIARGIGRVGASIWDDTVGQVFQGIIPGGSPGWWRADHDSPIGSKGSAVYENVLVPVAKSMANTVDTIGDLSFVLNPKLWTEGPSAAGAEWMDRVQEFRDDPVGFSLEHIGNISLTGSLVATPMRLGIAASRGAIPKAAVSAGLRPRAGRAYRTTAREATKQAAKEGVRQAKVADFLGDVVGHPYRTAWGKLRDSRAVHLFRSPSDPVTGVRKTTDNLGESNAPESITLEDLNQESIFAKDARRSAQAARTDIPSDDFVTTAGEALADVESQIAQHQAVSQVADNIPSDIATDPGARLNAFERLAQAAGYVVEDIRKSRGYQATFAKPVREARHIRDGLREGILKGTGVVAESLKSVSKGRLQEIGNVNLRKKWDPARNERLLIRDLRNLSKREDASRWINVIENVDLDNVTGSRRIGRAGEVLSGKRASGQSLDAEGLVQAIDTVIQEARRQANEAGGLPLETILKEMLPGVDPMGLHLLALNAVENLHGLPKDSLTAALIDRLELDKWADTNRRAQQALAEAGVELPPALTNRFRIPQQELGVDLNALPDQAKRFMDEALEQYRQELGSGREPLLVEEGLIPQGGTRIGQAGTEPTKMPTRLEDLPLTSDYRARLRAAETNKDVRRRAVENIEEKLKALEESGRPTMVRRETGKGLTLRDGKLTQSSLDSAWYRTSTGKAIDKLRKKLGEERLRLVEASAKLERLEQQAFLDPVNAPVSARNLLTYANRVAPEQARMLRELADSGVGDPSVYRQLADELDAVPKTIEELNSHEVYLAYIKDIKDRGAGDLGPTVSPSRTISTRRPSGTRRRGDATDIDYSRNFRARAYWQDAEFQSYFLSRQADELVRTQGLAKTGKARLLDEGFSESQISQMTEGQVQQALERMGLRVYQPDQLFGTSRKPSGQTSALDAEWITPFVEQSLMGAIQGPSGFERIIGQGVIDPLTNMWKVPVLPLRLAWQLNNVASNSLLSMLSAKVSPFDYPMLLRASSRAVKNWNKGIIDRLEIPLNDNYRAHLTSALNKTTDASHKAAIQQWLDQNAIVLDNSILDDISSSGFARGEMSQLNNSPFLRDIGARSNQNILRQYGIELPQVPGKVGTRLRNLRQSGRAGVDYSYHINDVADNMHRTLIYLDQIAKGASHTDAISQVVKTLGDYNKLSGFEKRVLKRVYPFYPWMRHITEVTARSLAPDNMLRTVVFMHLTQIFGEPNEWEELLPEWAEGHIYMGMDDNGLPKFLSTRGLNPFLDVFDPLSQPNFQGLLRPAHPGIQFAYEQLSGVSVLTGKPFTSPDIPFGSRETARPGLGEYLFRNVPQLGALRDVFRDVRGEPLTRYGTGEAAYYGDEELRSGLQSVQQLFGINVRPMDVQSIRENEILNEFRKAEQRKRYEEQAQEFRNPNVGY